MIRPFTNLVFGFIRWCDPKILLALFISVSFSQTTSAQEKTPKPAKVTFTAIALAELPYENLYYRNGEKATKIDFTNSRRSKPYPYPASEFFEVYTDPADPDDPKENYKLIGKATAIKDTRKILCFFRKNGAVTEDALPVELFQIDDSGVKFPEGSFRFINFMKQPIFIRFGENRFHIAPEESTIRKHKLSNSGAFVPFVITNMEGQTLGGTRLFSHATNREMVLIFPPKKGKKRLDIKYFSDRAPKPESNQPQ